MDKKKLPAKMPFGPGVYIFYGVRKKPLYIGRATNLKDRVRSYFMKNLTEARGPLVSEAIEKAKGVEVIATDSVLEAILLEAQMIKKHKPKYNTKEKDNKSFNFVVITREAYPKVLLKRGRELDKDGVKSYKYVFGPFPRGNLLTKALEFIRKIFPFRDKCHIPVGTKGKPCFHAQIGLCPGVCTGNVSQKEYAENIKSIVKLFKGQKKVLLKDLKKSMDKYAKEEKFEKAEEVLKQIESLRHIQDVSLISRDSLDTSGDTSFRIEAYDVSHLGGSSRVGMMVVMEQGELAPSENRKFNIKTKGGGDTDALKEMLLRRFEHSEWHYPNLIVVDGGQAQVNVTNNVLKGIGLDIAIVGVVKDDRHRPKQIIGSEYRRTKEKEILSINDESHRQVIRWHRKKRAVR